MLHRRSGFTLVELSIVLVILGLLVGGVLTGQSLIRAAELRSVTAQQQSFLTAINAFKDKYFAIPGDMTNATSFWGTAAAGATCATTAGTGTATCNGDGNGGLSVTAPTSNEVFRFWQHLANAGLIAGTFSGIKQGTGDDSASPLNTPSAKISTALWYANTTGTASGQAYIFDGAYGNTLMMGGYAPGTYPAISIFKPEDLWNIDKKIDDGKPGTGTMRVIVYVITTCTTATATNDLTADYQLSNTSPNCKVTFPNAF